MRFPHRFEAKNLYAYVVAAFHSIGIFRSIEYENVDVVVQGPACGANRQPTLGLPCTPPRVRIQAVHVGTYVCMHAEGRPFNGPASFSFSRPDIRSVPDYPRSIGQSSAVP